jgi:dipeptidyl aminopeptidase/acylaminoacyl peptidase
VTIEGSEYLDALLNLPSLSGAMRSPDGLKIALVGFGIHPNLDVFLLDVEGKEKIQALTETPEFTDLVDWWPDSESVIVEEDKGRNERVTIYRIFLDRPTELIALTEIDPNYYVRGANISPDGKFLYYFANYDFKTKEETEIFSLYKHNLDSGAITKLTSVNKPAYNMGELNLQGTQILYNRSDIDPAGDQYFTINVDGSEDFEILNFGDKAKIGATWHPDGNQVIFDTDHLNGKQLDKRLVGIYDSYTREIQWINKKGEALFPELVGHDFRHSYFSDYDPDNLILLETVKARSTSWLANLKTKKCTRVPKSLGSLTPRDRLNDGSWVASYYSSTQPTTLVKVSEGTISKLTTDDLFFYYDNFEHSKLEKQDLVQAEDYDWIADDSTPIHGWFYKSKTESKRLIVFAHGGPSSHSSDSISTEIQYYLHQGFNVLDPNYRGSTGYSLKFREAIKEDGWGGREQSDIASGVKSLVKEGKIDKSQVAITGTSYGGFSSWCGITKYSDTFKAAAPVCGMTDLVVDYETTRPDLRPYSEEMMGGSPDEVPERYRKGSPIHYLDRIGDGKILIVQGARDPNVTPANVEEVEAALHKAEVEYETLIFDDEGHGIVRKENRRRKMIEIADFFNEMLE